MKRISLILFGLILATSLLAPPPMRRPPNRKPVLTIQRCIEKIMKFYKSAQSLKALRTRDKITIGKKHYKLTKTQRADIDYKLYADIDSMVVYCDSLRAKIERLK